MNSNFVQRHLHRRVGSVVLGVLSGAILLGSLPVAASANTLPPRLQPQAIQPVRPVVPLSAPKPPLVTGTPAPKSIVIPPPVSALGTGGSPIKVQPGFRQASEAIDAEYAQVARILGSQISDLARTPGGTFYKLYELGVIFYTGATGAHEVHGAIRAKYDTLGGPDGFLGPPLTDELAAGDNVGWYNHFKNGTIVWTPETGANEVHGAIRDEWANMGWQTGPLGYPKTDQVSAGDNVGWYNHFQNGSIFWTPDTGAHEVHGAIRDRWAALGWQTSYLGYPKMDEFASAEPGSPAGRISVFQYGKIIWTSEKGAVDFPEVILHRENIVTPSPEALGGWAELELRSDGNYCFRGSMHDSGIPDYSFVVSALVLPTDGNRALGFAIEKAGRVEGTEAWRPGHYVQRDFDWPPPFRIVPDSFPPKIIPVDPSEVCSKTPNSDLRANWPSVHQARIEIHHEYTDELLDALEGLAKGELDKLKDEAIQDGIGFLIVLVATS